MPDPVTHYVFGQRCVAQLPEDIRKAVEMPVFQRALQGPDPWSCLGVFGGKAKAFSRRGVEMHRTETGEFLSVLTQQTKQDKALFSVLAGNICHYCLDRLTHPYIIGKADPNGGHTRLERAIDSYYIRSVYGKKPWHFSLPRNVFSCKQYPDSLRPGLDAVYKTVYGWENTFPLINKSLRDERRFYGLMQDPTGIVHYLLRMLPSRKINFSLYSYFHREIDSQKIDYLNEKHDPWQHPFDPAIVSTDSFFDLFEQAKADAIEMIRAAYDWVFGNSESFPLYENSHYSTGFPCDDPRNENTPLYQRLAYSGKYWN